MFHVADGPPGVSRASDYAKIRVRSQAPIIPFGFALAIERTTRDSDADAGVRLFRGIFPLLTTASIRLRDAGYFLRLRYTQAVVAGVSINRKDSGDALMNWGSPKCGLRFGGRWFG